MYYYIQRPLEGVRLNQTEAELYCTVLDLVKMLANFHADDDLDMNSTVLEHMHEYKTVSGNRTERNQIKPGSVAVRSGNEIEETQYGPTSAHCNALKTFALNYRSSHTGHCYFFFYIDVAVADAFSCALYPAANERNTFAATVSDRKLCIPHTLVS